MKTLYFLALFLGLYTHSANSQISINEWMASNSSIIEDPQYGESGDWIELYNNTTQAINIGGYFLTDNNDDPTKWSIPNGTAIQSQNFLLIWADGYNAGFHSSFKLTKEGEEIALYNKDTILIDHVQYKHQKTNVSMGRKADGDAQIGFFDQPTPGTSNNTTFYNAITFYHAQYSVRGGIQESNQSLELSSIDGNIFYTFDGSEPTTSSLQYASPIAISSSTIIRARVLETGNLPGPIVTNSYFYADKIADKALPIVSIVGNPEYFWDPEIGIYVQNFKPEWEYPINIELFENDGSDRAGFNELTGVRVNGQNSWQLPQKMLGIYFDNDYGNNNLDYNLFYDSRRKKFDNFILRASGSDWSYTLFRDGLCQELTKYSMDIELMSYKPSVLFINGEYMGIHNIRARIDEGFIEDNFGYTGDEYDLIEDNGIVENGDDIAFQELFDLFDNDLSVQSNYDEVEAIFDVQNFAEYFITEIYTSNSSWGHNIKMWKPKNEGKWRWILQDFDRGFSGENNNLINYFTTDDSPTGYNWARSALRSMLENDEFAAYFSQLFLDHMYTTYHPVRVTQMIDTVKGRIEPEILSHIDRWMGTTSNYGNAIPDYEFWLEEVQELYDFAQNRQAYIIDDLQSEFAFEDETRLGMMVSPEDAGNIFINKLKIPGSPWNGSYFENLPFSLEAKPLDGYDFLGWSKAVFIDIIEVNSEWKFNDSGTDLGDDWNSQSYNDETWSSGQAQLGYGDGDEETVISYGNNGNDKHISYYFRKVFSIDNIEDFQGTYQLKLLCDDGAVVYINGVEIARSNLPTGPINYLTEAINGLGGAAEDIFTSYVLALDMLVQGENTIAVEVHQANPTSSDISFNLSLQGTQIESDELISVDQVLAVNLSHDTFLIANFERNEFCLLEREIIANTTLTTDCSPYLAPYDVFVMEGVNLTIDPGVEVHFAENINLYVHGQLLAEGSETQEIKFKSLRPDELWGGLHFVESTLPSHLSWIDIEGASQGPHPIYQNAAISSFQSADLDLDHVTITSVDNNPMLFYYTNVSLTNSKIQSDVTGDLINIKYGNGHVASNEFVGNKEVDTDAIDFDEVPDGMIIDNKISNFFGFNSDGIDIGEQAKNVEISGNFITNCSDKAISVGQRSSAYIDNNTISNCNIGVAVKDQSVVYVDKMTSYNVPSAIASFEKNPGIGGGSAYMTNSIISNSPAKSVLVDSKSILDMSYNLFDTDTITTTENIFGDPLFFNPVEYDFQLESNSPAILTGIDEIGEPTDIGTDIHTYKDISKVMITEIHYNPDTDPDAEFIRIFNPTNQEIDLTGYQFSGAIEHTFPIILLQAGESVILAKDPQLIDVSNAAIYPWNIGKLSNSGEKITLSDPYGIIVDHVKYNDKAPWPLDADGLGYSLSLISTDLDNHFAQSWEAKVVSSQEHEDFNRDFTMFPNPTAGATMISAATEAINYIEIYDVLGTKIFEQEIHSQQEWILPANQYEAGVWLVRINKSKTRPLVIIR